MWMPVGICLWGILNIEKMVQKLDVDLKIEKINWGKERDFQLAFFLNQEYLI